MICVTQILIIDSLTMKKSAKDVTFAILTCAKNAMTNCYQSPKRRILLKHNITHCLGNQRKDNFELTTLEHDDNLLLNMMTRNYET